MKEKLKYPFVCRESYKLKVIKAYVSELTMLKDVYNLVHNKVLRIRG